MAARLKINPEDWLRKQAEQYLHCNPDLVKTLKLFRITNEQYIRFWELFRPKIQVSSDSTNEFILDKQ
jgi:hypothetical protein